MKNLYLKYVLAVLKDVIKSIVLMGIAEIIIMNFVGVKKKENLDMKIMINNFNASINIKKQGLKMICCVSGTDSQLKQKRGKALPLGESMTHEAQPIAFGLGG